MPKYFDDDGNEVEYDVSPEEAKELQEKAKKAEELEKVLQEKETEIEKLSKKDINFKKLNFKNQKELEEKTADWNEREKALRDKIAEFESAVYAPAENTKNKLFDEYAGGDEKLKEKLQNEFEAIGGNNAKTPDEVKAHMDKAAIFVQHELNKTSNPINQYSPSSIGTGMPSSSRKTNFADTEGGKKLAASLGIDIEEPKKD